MLDDLAPYFAAAGLTKMQDHLHVLLASCCFWEIVRVCSAMVSPRLSSSYRLKLTPYKQFDWDVHVVSLVHALVVSVLALPLFWDPQLVGDRLFGYSKYGGDVYALTSG